MIAPAAPICYLNGELLPIAEAKISVLDRGFIFGDAIYEVIPAAAGRVFAGDLHIERLANSLRAVGLANPLAPAQWAALFAALLAANGDGDFCIYVQVTRGVAERDHAIPPGIAPTIFAMCRPFKVSAALAHVSAITLVDNRWGRCDIKSTSLLPNILLRHQAASVGAYEALLLREGMLTEGAASNVFVVRAGQVRTPPLSTKILPGVTRALLIEVLRSNGVAVFEEEIAQTDLGQADEIWLTSSSRDLVCVNQLDGLPVGDGEHYPVAEKALTLFQTLKP